MASYTTIDLNSGSPQTVLNPSGHITVYGVYMEHGGSTAVVKLESTDGTDTAVLTPGQAAGDGVDFTGPIHLYPDDTLQIHPTTVEGSAQTNEAVVVHD